MNEQTLQIRATPANTAEPTLGPWFITCSVCGALGMGVTTAGTDHALIEHHSLHRADILTSPA